MTEAYYKSLEPFFGSWHIKDFIGRGSYGQVYKIEKEDISGVYSSAMKIISVANDPDAGSFSGGMTQQNIDEYYTDLVINIVREFKVMEKLKGNTNVVCYEDHEIRKRDDGKGYDIFIRMEQLTPIGKHFGSVFPGEEEVIKLGIDMCRALELCHKNSIIHRDVKPQNIFVSSTGDYKLGDFGVARTFENTIGEFSAKGTFDYMAPEVQLRQPYGVGADIFSLGAVLYKLMNNGRIAFLPDYPASLKSCDYETALERRLNGDVPKKPALASNAFANVIIKAISFDPCDRYESAEKMRKALENASGIIDDNKNLKYSVYKPSDSGDGFVFKGSGVIAVKPREKGKAKDIPQPVMDVSDEQPSFLPPLLRKEMAKKTQPNPVVYPEKTKEIKEEPAEKRKKEKKEKVKKEKVEKVKKAGKKPILSDDRKKKKLSVGFIVAIVAVSIHLALVIAFFVIARNPALHDKLQAVLPFDISFLKPDSQEPSQEWREDGYQENYPFYSVERLYVDGIATDECRVNEEITKYSQDEAKLFYIIDYETGVAKRVLYLNGSLTDYTETLSENEVIDGWVIEGYETDTFREYARKYENGEMTDLTCYTGKVYEAEYFVSIENGKMNRLLYVDKKPVSSVPLDELSQEEWVIEGYEAETYRQYARKYVNGAPTDETKLTGLVYPAEDYYVYDNSTKTYYIITYVDSVPVSGTAHGSFATLEDVQSAWVISEDYEKGTYNEYAEHYVYGEKTDEIKYTGAKKQIVEWKVEGYRSVSPYYQYERKYVNGEKTDETRNTTPYKTDPSRAPKEEPPKQPEKPEPTPQQPSPEEQEPSEELPYYMNPDGTINFSELRVEYWYDEEDREFKIWYDKDGNEVIRFATGAYRVRKNNN